ncbi:MAG: thioredoxin [Candidatus Kerfeldbacteria bacterium]|nr:thioredoxin [Candidatus Kerfeldbacteria bacterium]
MAEITLTDQNFEAEVLQSSTPVLVDFWASWCGPCKQLGPVLEEVAKEYEGKPVKIAKLNVDENSATAQKYGIQSIPSLLIFKGGQPVDQSLGFIPKPQLKAFIDKHL